MMSSSSSREEFQSLMTRNDGKDSVAKEKSVHVQSMEEKSVTLTGTDDKVSTVKELADVHSAVETSAGKNGNPDNDLTVKESSSVAIQSAKEIEGKDGKDYNLKESTGPVEFLATRRKESVPAALVLSSRENILTLRSRDDQEFTVKESVAFQSALIKEKAKRGGASNPIHLPNVDGKTLAMVLDYLNVTYGDSEASAEEKRKCEPEELAKKELHDLLDMYGATDYLEIKDSSEVFFQAVRDNIDNIELPENPPLPDIDDYPAVEEDDDYIRTGFSSDFDD